VNTRTVNPSLAAKRVGQFVRQRRLHLGLSRAQLARRLGFVLGSVVSHVERGDTRIAPQAMAEWARALEMDPVAFAREVAILGGTETERTADVPFIRAAWAA